MSNSIHIRDDDDDDDDGRFGIFATRSIISLPIHSKHRAKHREALHVRIFLHVLYWSISQTHANLIRP